MRLLKHIGFFFLLGTMLGQMPLWAQNPTVVTNNISGAMACAGSSVSVSFVASNLINPTKRSFIVQLSNIGGAFNSPISLGAGTKSPILVTLPATTIGGDYRLRVITDTTGVTSTPSAVFMMLKSPTATLTGDTTINVGGTATLSLFFSGNGPWTYAFTNTNTGTTSSNPLRGNVQPVVSTTYTLQSVSNICGTGPVSGSAKVTVIPRITTDFSTASVCAGASSSVPFTLTGAFATAGVTYTVQLSDVMGNFSNPLPIGTGTVSPISVKFPADLAAGTGYRIRVIASATSTTVVSNAFIVKPLPTATLTGGASITIGESTNLNLSFTGDAPWTYKLSNNQTGTVTATPATISVAPTISTIYTLQSVSNSCGNGSVSGSALVTVIPRISVADVALGSVCVGTNISLPFTVAGSFERPVSYTVQLSDASGSFSMPRNLNTGSSSPIDVSIPTNLSAGTGYRLRVIASANATLVNSPAFAIKVRPTAVISGNPTINFGENAALNLNFTGEGPWTFVLSDGTTATTDRTPFVANVKPAQTSTYLVNSVRNLCGEGSTSGSALVTVIPRLVTDNPTTAVCSGKDVEIKFGIGGTLPANTTFQAQLSDSTGNFTNAIAIGTGNRSPLVATIPSNIVAGGSYRIRVIVVGSSSIITVPTAPFFLGRRPTAVLSGGNSLPIKPGEELFLVIQLSGDAPWSYVLSDNTSGNALSTPVILSVAPMMPTTYTLKSVNNTCGEGTVSGSVVANVIITSTDDLVQDKIAAFPNPITERLNIKITIPDASEWQVTDFQGRIWQSRTWPARAVYEETINTQALPVGTYIFRVKIGEQWFDKKIVKW